MDEKILDDFKVVLNNLIPDAVIEIHTVDDLTDSIKPTIQELCEIAELITRLSREERA